MDIKDIILFILIIVNIYLFYNTKKRENFNTTDNIKNAINDKYKFDLQSMRELSDFATLIRYEYDKFTFESDIICGRDLIVEDLIVKGNVKFTNKDNSKNILNIFPRYSIVAWANDVIPKGWAQCTGDYYILNENGIAIATYDTNTPNKILTPDLRSRFIKGVAASGKSGSRLNDEYIFGKTYGEQKQKLTINQIPKHSHNFQLGYSLGSGGGSFTNEYANLESIPYGYLGSYGGRMSDSWGTNPNLNFIFTSKTGGPADTSSNTSSNTSSEGHNNMPPYYALYYIMKL